MSVAKLVHYSGTVQGVGFRYTTRGLATGYAVAGYVRNLPNGDVELLAEGPADQVAGFLDAVAHEMRDCIRDVTVQDVAPGGHRDFVIRR